MTTQTLTASELAALRAQVEATFGDQDAPTRDRVLAGWASERETARARKAAGLPRQEWDEELPLPTRPAVTFHPATGPALRFESRADYDRWAAAQAAEATSAA